VRKRRGRNGPVGFSFRYYSYFFLKIKSRSRLVDGEKRPFSVAESAYLLAFDFLLYLRYFNAAFRVFVNFA